VQEVFVKIIEKPELFDAGKKFSTWIYTVTANQCRNLLRNEENRLRILKENSSSADLFMPEQRTEFDRKVLKEKIGQAISALSNREQNIYTLRFEEELTIKEIASLTSMPEGSVKSGLFHLLKKIGKHLKEFEHENR
jgi:RNA polymerase sigma-70 factor (ECF subfamily)